MSWFARLIRLFRRPARLRRPAPVRPRVDALEDRRLLSVSVVGGSHQLISGLVFGRETEHVLEQRLTDGFDEGGLFGFRF